MKSLPKFNPRSTAAMMSRIDTTLDKELKKLLPPGEMAAGGAAPVEVKQPFLNFYFAARLDGADYAEAEKFALRALAACRPQFTAKHKGALRGGPCCRTVCTETDAEWWNSSTRKWYCAACARMINQHAPGLCVRQAADGEPVSS